MRILQWDMDEVVTIRWTYEKKPRQKYFAIYQSIYQLGNCAVFYRKRFFPSAICNRSVKSWFRTQYERWVQSNFFFLFFQSFGFFSSIIIFECRVSMLRLHRRWAFLLNANTKNWSKTLWVCSVRCMHCGVQCKQYFKDTIRHI